jgi:hypothetical protein
MTVTDSGRSFIEPCSVELQSDAGLWPLGPKTCLRCLLYAKWSCKQSILLQVLPAGGHGRRAEVNAVHYVLKKHTQ